MEGYLVTFDDCVTPPELTIEPAEETQSDDPSVEYDAVSLYYVCDSSKGYTDVADIYFQLARITTEDGARVWLVDTVVMYIAPLGQQAETYAITEQLFVSAEVHESHDSYGGSVDWAWLNEIMAMQGTLFGMMSN